MRFPDQNNDRCCTPLLGPIGTEGLRSNIHEPRNRKVLLETKNNIPCRKVRSNRTTISQTYAHRTWLKVINHSTFYYYWNKMEEDSDYDTVESEPVSIMFLPFKQCKTEAPWID